MKYWTFTKGLPANASLGQTWKKLGLHCVGVWESLSQQNMNMKSSKPQINEKMKITLVESEIRKEKKKKESQITPILEKITRSYMVIWGWAEETTWTQC